MKKYLYLILINILFACQSSNTDTVLPNTTENTQDAPHTQNTQVTEKNLVDFITTEDEWDLKSSRIQVLQKIKGTGTSVQLGQLLDIHWRLSLIENGKRGKVLYSSYESNITEPVIMQNNLYPVWLKILDNQRVGAEISALVPPGENIGPREAFKVPKMSHVVFDFFILRATNENKAPQRPQIKEDNPDWKVKKDGLKIYYIKKGHGVKVKKNSYLTFNFTAWSPDGKRPPIYSDHYGKPINTFYGANTTSGLPPHWQDVAKHLRAGDVVYARIPYVGKNKKIRQSETFYLLLEMEDVVDGPELAKIPKHDERWMVLPSGLQFIHLKKGRGRPSYKGATLSIHFSAWLKSSGQIFGSTLFSKTPYTYTLGKNEVIKGLEEISQYVHEGDIVYAKFTPELAFGPNGRKGVPKKSTVIYQLEVITIK